NKAEAFALLCEQKPEWLARIARRATAAHAARRDLEEIFQNACLKAHEHWEGFLSSGLSLKTWFYRIVLVCVIVDHRYQTTRKRTVQLEEAYPDHSSVQLLKGLVSEGTDPGSRMARAERIHTIMSLLTPEDQHVLAMRIFDEMTSKEIGQVLGVEDNAVRQRYARARLRFGELWKERFGAEGSKP